MCQRVLISAVVLLVTITLTGCAEHLKRIPLERSELARLNQQATIHVAHYPPAAFWVLDADFQPVRTLSGFSDPAQRVRQQFVSSLEARLALKNIRFADKPLLTDDAAGLQDAFPEGVVLEFKTLDWQMLGLRRGTAFLSYQARARLVRPQDATVLWQGGCHSSTAFRKTLYPAQWMENDAAVLRAELDKSADECAKDLLALFFGSA